MEQHKRMVQQMEEVVTREGVGQQGGGQDDGHGGVGAGGVEGVPQH